MPRISSSSRRWDVRGVAVVLTLLVLGEGVAWAQGQAAAPPDAAAVDAAAPAVEADPAAAVGEEEEAKGPWIIEHLKAGGKTVAVQLLLSVLGLGVAIERYVNLRRAKVAPRELARRADALWQQGKFDELERTARGDGSVLGEVIGVIVKHRTYSAAEVSTLAGDLASRRMRAHGQKCYPIAIVATLEPLLGLLGTVIGMIAAFDVVALAGAMGNPSILAESIAVALITTEVGLVIAIPALFVYHHLKGRAAVLGMELEEEASELIGRWLMHPTSPAPAPSTTAAAPAAAVAPAPAAPAGAQEVSHAAAP